MSKLAALTKRGLESAYDRFGDAAVFTEKSGWETECTVIVDTSLDHYGEKATLSGKTAVICVRTTEVPEKPHRQDKFTVQSGDDCTTYEVDSVLTSDNFEHRCLVA
jgi:hypothetical protein